LKHLLILLLFTHTAYSKNAWFGASKNDTSKFYIDHSEHLLIKPVFYIKSNTLDITKRSTAQTLKLGPNGSSSLGVNVNYKWLGIGAGFGLKASDASIQKKGETKRTDFQLSVYTKKIVIDAFAQRYLGYHLKKPNALTSKWNEPFLPQLKSMEAITIGVGGYYVFNYKKFSFKAAYVRNAVQKKSAGSFLLGSFFTVNSAEVDQRIDSSFIPDYLPNTVKKAFPLKSFSAISYGISFGYTYTFVFFKNFFVNVALIPGAGGKQLKTADKDGTTSEEKGLVVKTLARAAIGYEGQKMLFGITSYSNAGNFNYDDYQIKPSTSNFRIFVAKKFKWNQ
jgi:Domain of unknown function (DUF4421)